MSRGKKGKYTIPKARVAGPIIAYTLVFFIIVGMIYAVLNILSEYITDVRSEPDKEYVLSVAEIYNKDTDGYRENALDKLVYDGHDYCVIDIKGNVVISHGDTTVNGFDIAKEQFGDESFKEILEDAGIEEEAVQEVGIHLLAVKQDDCFTVYDQKTTLSAFKETVRIITDNPGVLLDGGEEVVTFPYWVGTTVSEKGDTQLLLVKCDLSIRVKDYTYLAGGVLIAWFIATIIFVIMLIGVIRNLNANRKMRSLLFRDDIAKGRNWLWYAISSQDILRKGRNANKTYAVVEIVFIKYRNFVLCHSVKEADDLMREVVKKINKKLGKKELCAHCASSSLALLMEVIDEENARARLQDIVNELEAIPCGHKLSFRTGVFLVTPAKQKIAQKQKRFIPDVDMYYNNACTAGLSVADIADSSIAFFDEDLIDEEKWIDKVTERQQKAVEDEEFLVYYQPKYDPRTNQLMGAEALIRWNTPDKGLIPPFKFIPIFEDNGFITQIDDYMITHVARDQRKWLNEGRRCVPVSVNVSRAHFSEEKLAEHICGIVDREQCPHDLLEIELTESAFFDDENAMIETITKLKSFGFLVSMDDFGSGYSSLNSLKDMPLDILKLDAGFFRGSEDNPRYKTVVSEVLKLANSLDMKTVAEGVEEQSQVDFLANEGCDMIQGYYYSKPMPREEYESRIISAQAQPAVTQPVVAQPAAQPVNAQPRASQPSEVQPANTQTSSNEQ